MYRLLLMLHVGGVVIFIGMIVSALIWQHAADQSRNRTVVAHTYRVLNRFDAILTPVAVATIAVTGVLLAHLARLPIIRTGWIFWSLLAWGISGVLFAAVLFPLQRRLESEADEEAMWSQSRDAYMRLSSRWARWAHLTLIGIVIAFGLMVLQPVLPTP